MPGRYIFKGTCSIYSSEYIKGRTCKGYEWFKSQPMVRKKYGSRLCTPIRYNVRLSEAPGNGKTIYEFAPGSNGAHDYRDLIRKITNNDKVFR